MNGVTKITTLPTASAVGTQCIWERCPCPLLAILKLGSIVDDITPGQKAHGVSQGAYKLWTPRTEHLD